MTGKMYLPASLVFDVCFPLVARSVRTTVAPGTTPPCGSVTRPEMLPDEAVCACAELTASVHTTATQATHPTKNASLFICDPPREKRLCYQEAAPERNRRPPGRIKPRL